MYAVVVPGFACICKTWEEVERIQALYFYPKFAKVQTEEEAQEFIKRNRTKHFITDVFSYGDIFPDLHVKAWYRISKDSVFYKFDMQKLGNVKLKADNCLIEYHGRYVYVRVNDIFLSDKTVKGHLAAVYNLLALLGDYVDVQLYLPNFSIYYVLTNYKAGRIPQVNTLKQLIEHRLGNVAYNLIGVNLE